MKDSIIRGLAWFLIVTQGLVMVFYPCFWGKPRDPAHYGAESWAYKVLDTIIIVPIVGRVLGWW